MIAQQDRADNAQALDDKEQIDREADGFQLQTQSVETRKDNTGDMFGGPSVDDYQHQHWSAVRLLLRLEYLVCSGQRVALQQCGTENSGQ